MNLKEAIAPDTIGTIAFDIVKIAVPAFVRLALYTTAVIALCMASVVYTSRLVAMPNLGSALLVIIAALAVLAGWALRRAAKFKAANVAISFCAPHRELRVGVTSPRRP